MAFLVFIKNILRLSHIFAIFWMIQIFFVKNTNGQTFNLQEINILSESKSFFESSRKITADTLLSKIFSTKDISKILELISPALLKNYGSTGSLTTISMRGTSANQTSLLWNGFPINSVSSGDADLSSLTGAFFASVEIIPGASASVFGSGTFGGAVNLKNNFVAKGQKNTLSFETGSYGYVSGNISSEVSTKKLSLNISTKKIIAENNFKYIDDYMPEKPELHRSNNSFIDEGIILGINIKPVSKINIESGLWLQKKYKQIPEPAGTYSSGNKIQTDSTLKTFLKISRLAGNGKFSAGFAFFNDFLHYTDKINPEDTFFYIDSKISGKKIISDISFKKYFSKNFTAETGFSYKNLHAETLSYKEFDNELNTYLSAKLVLKNFNYYINSNLNFYENSAAIFLYNTGINYYTKKITVRTSISKNFRKPTFNELYWNPGGNAYLKSESGISGNLGFEFIILKNSIANLSICSDNWFSDINNYIQWIPQNGLWSAVNYKTTYLLGNETNLNFKTYFNKKQIIYINLSYQYNYSFNKIYEDLSVSKSGLIYIPKNSAKGFIMYSINKFQILFSAEFAGTRYTTADLNSKYALKPYVINNINVSYENVKKNTAVNTSLEFDNVFNSKYESVKSFPMPGRILIFKISITYFKKEKKL